MDKEYWRDVIGYEGLYMVSNTGIVKSKRAIKKTWNGFGYVYVYLWKNGKNSSCRVHRLVAQAFIPNPENKSSVNHIDGIKDNNSVYNLEWCTQKENIKHSIDNDLRTTSIPVSMFSLDGILLKDFKSMGEASRFAKIRAERIAKLCKGKGRKMKKDRFIWKYQTLDKPT